MEASMRSFNVIAVATLLATIVFSGCFGDDGPAKAAFTSTTTDKLTYTFDASSSSGDGLSYSWDFGDRTEPKTGKVVQHTYQYPNGRYKVTLTVTDAAKVTNKATQEVQVGEGSNAGPVLYVKADKRLTPGTPDVVMFDATESYDADGDPLFFEWDMNSVLSDDELNQMENLGWHQYGRYPQGKGPPPANGGGSNGSAQGDEVTLTLSGHDWAKELEKARKSVFSRVGIQTLDGDHSPPPPEPRNDGFNGKINDTTPIVLFEFPNDPATYFVHVRVYDVKGAMAEGFLRIKVAETVPEARQQVEAFKDIEFAPFQLEPLEPSGNVVVNKKYDIMHDYPGVVEAYLNFSENPDNPRIDAKMGVYSCATGSSFGDCRGSSKKAEGIASPVVLRYNVTADRAGPEKGAALLQVTNLDNSGSTPTKATLIVVKHYDLNPWALDESGLGGAHH